MTDLLQASHDGLFALANVAGVTTLAPVFTNVPEGQQPPFVEIGAIDAEEIGGKSGGLEKHGIEIEFRTRGSSKRPLMALMHAARSAIDRQRPYVEGAEFGEIRWIASATDREDDGVTHHGVQRYEVIVQQGE